MSEEKELRDAIVILPTTVVASVFEGRVGSVGAEQKVRNITRWETHDSQLILFRGVTEIARFRDWVGVRSQAVDA